MLIFWRLYISLSDTLASFSPRVRRLRDQAFHECRCMVLNIRFSGDRQKAQDNWTALPKRDILPMR